MGGVPDQHGGLARRDPLVQYKNKAFEMFRELLDNMRTGVVNRMFTYRPRDLSSVQTTVTTPSQLEAPEPVAKAMIVKADAPQGRESRPSKGKRHRRRR